jgi:opacity protein-like surface antigen
MNARQIHLSLGLSAAAIILAAGHAAAQPSRFYVKADAGGNITSDVSMTGYFGPVDPGTKVTFDPGIRLGLAGGYHVTDWFATELETGLMANHIHSITGANQLDANFSNTPLLANLRFQLPGQHRLTPYFGGGLGGSVSILNADPMTLNGITIQGSAGALVFAYQAFAGLEWNLNEHMSVGVEYHYFATEGPSLQADFVSSGISSDRIVLGGAQTQSFSLLFKWTF